MKYEMYRDAADEYRWRLKAGNGEIIADSGEGYKNKSDCQHGIDLTKNSGDADEEDNT
ncbi:MAG: hypothetical protein CMP08_09270 [Xanthomonadales bacterium]|nr:hypothetical protein [Xanthomonadales bacterium]|tara:strand:+ start:198 stop:371 length:174 start_codon:yes stop_codon:yes gene_type:complete